MMETSQSSRGEGWEKGGLLETRVRVFVHPKPNGTSLSILEQACSVFSQGWKNAHLSIRLPETFYRKLFSNHKKGQDSQPYLFQLRTCS